MAHKVLLGVAIAVSAAYWVAGQDLGGVLTGQATDPGTAAAMILVASMLLARVRCTPDAWLDLISGPYASVADPARVATP